MGEHFSSLNRSLLTYCQDLDDEFLSSKDMVLDSSRYDFHSRYVESCVSTTCPRIEHTVVLIFHKVHPLVPLLPALRDVRLGNLDGISSIAPFLSPSLYSLYVLVEEYLLSPLHNTHVFALNLT